MASISLSLISSSHSAFVWTSASAFTSKLCRQLARFSHLQKCQLALQPFPQAPDRTILLPTTCGSVTKSLPTTAFTSTFVSVLPAHLASISARVGASVTTGDVAFRSVIAWPTFPVFTCASPSTQPPYHAMCHLVSWSAPLQGCNAACLRAPRILHHQLSRQN